MRRCSLLCPTAAGFLVALVAAGQTGVTPRPSSSEYPVHQVVGTATVAAALVPPDQVKKLFPGKLIKRYIVVEVAVYPQDGQTVDIDSLDFALRLSTDERSHPRTPQEVATMWDERRAPSPLSGADVTVETGVVYSSGNDPIEGRTRGWGTYTGVGVGTATGPPDPPPPPPYDPHAVEARVRAKALPEGRTMRAVAGYLYFPVPPKKAKSAPRALEYLKGSVATELPFPAK